MLSYITIIDFYKKSIGFDMKQMWSPWRSQYINSFKDEKNNKNENKCFFCEAITNTNNNKELLVVARRKHSIVMLNKFPYNSGHILIAPNRHIGEMEDFNDEEYREINDLVKQTVSILKQCYKPEGFNIGINLGRIAGAGVPGHLHYHVVPRWGGDSNFMPVIADIRVVSQSLEDAQQLLEIAFSK